MPLHAYLNRITLGDCLDVLPRLPAASVDLVVTDPPYITRYRSRDGRTLMNDDNAQWIRPAFAEMYRVLRPDSFCISFYGWHAAALFLDAWRAAGFRPVGHFVWTKPYSSQQGMTRRHHESAYLLAKGRPCPPARPLRDVLPWRYTGNWLHPTQKPVMAIRPLIAAYSAIGDIVLDPFAGSGTTAIAAWQLERSCIAIECDRDYWQQAEARLNGSLGNL